MGRKVPYDLYQVLKFCDSCDYAKEELAGKWQEIWKTEMWKYINPYSLVSYYLFTDYLAAVDQQAKNMQPMFFLEDGCSVKDGVYSEANGMEACILIKFMTVIPVTVRIMTAGKPLTRKLTPVT